MKSCFKKNYKFDLEVKEKGHTEVMNLHDTHLMCQMWYAN